MFSIIGRIIAFSIFIYYAHSIYNDPDFYLGKYFSIDREYVIYKKSNGGNS